MISSTLIDLFQQPGFVAVITALLTGLVPVLLQWNLERQRRTSEIAQLKKEETKRQLEATETHRKTISDLYINTQSKLAALQAYLRASSIIKGDNQKQSFELLSLADAALSACFQLHLYILSRGDLDRHKIDTFWFYIVDLSTNPLDPNIVSLLLNDVEKILHTDPNLFVSNTNPNPSPE